jgi:hypothetical protein
MQGQAPRTNNGTPLEITLHRRLQLQLQLKRASGWFGEKPRPTHAEPFGDAFKRHAHLSRLLQWQIEITCNCIGVETPRTSSGGNSSLES